jgi:hypothetical protein
MTFSEIAVYSATTVEEWTAVLDLAAKWKFESIRAFAIKQLESIASPIDKIVIGRGHNVLDWLVDAYGAVCERTDALTLDEAKLLGMEDVVKISSLRQDIRDGRPFGPLKASVAGLRRIFVTEFRAISPKEESFDRVPTKYHNEPAVEPGQNREGPGPIDWGGGFGKSEAREAVASETKPALSIALFGKTDLQDDDDWGAPPTKPKKTKRRF